MSTLYSCRLTQMDLLITNCFTLKSSYLPPPASRFLGRENDVCGHPPNFFSNYAMCNTKALAGRNQAKGSRNRGNTNKLKRDLPPTSEQSSDESLDKPFSGADYVEDGEIKMLPFSNVPSRNAVLQACIVTSGLIAALGLLIRQVSHIASGEGWSVVDCSAAITLNFELWHLELIAGSVLLVSSCRFLLLKIWPDFAESSNTANQQVLASLEPLDYFVVAFLPGISEELLFRGALLPLLGDNWTSIFAVAALFGTLHLGSGRNYSFAIWATFVGIVYGFGAVFSASVTVPMASHALNNLVGGIIWRKSSTSSSSKSTE